MKLPEVQNELRELARSIRPQRKTVSIIYERRVAWADRLEELIAEIPRRSPVRKAPAGARVSVTTATRRAIRAYAEAHPGVDQARIAQIFNVNPGRVSEALRGKRR